MTGSLRTWRAAAIALSIVLLLVVIGNILYFSRGWLGFGRRYVDSPAVITQIKRLNELSTVRYSIQRVVGIREQKIPVGEESILLMVQGEAIAGVDLSEFNQNDVLVSKTGDVFVSLPRARLLRTYLDEDKTRIWDRSITWWTPWVPYNPELDRQARLQALDDIRKAALGMGILNQAQRNAEAAIREVLGAFGIYPQFRPRSS